ncbi:hypothetical protein EAG_03044 [Camponotus floridanus]|uniref:Uncharacterized protein n=1 Tax=Camponotus floridanus TaxID=104421 RepID=E2ANV0_CAMFO|nr:hypothetical protein EAG_03044 [Camponotus floridanus]
MLLCMIRDSSEKSTGGIPCRCVRQVTDLIYSSSREIRKEVHEYPRRSYDDICGELNEGSRKSSNTKATNLSYQSIFYQRPGVEISRYNSTYIAYYAHNSQWQRDRVTKQRAKNEGGRAKAKPNARSWHVRAKPLFIGFTGSGPPQKATGIASLEGLQLAQIEGVAKWKLRRRLLFMLHPAARRPPPEHTFAYIVGPRSHSLVASSSVP